MKYQNLFFCLLCLWAVVFGEGEAERVPFRGWEQSLRMENEAVEVVVVPATGRIVHLARKGGKNLLTFKEKLAGKLPPAEEGYWLNYGGDWMWPVHQDQWEKMGGPQWPPLRVLDQVWKGEMEHRKDGTGVITLRASFGAPLHLEAERRIFLPPGKTTDLVIEQSLRRVEASEIPVTLWQIAQVDAAEMVFLDRSPKSQFDEGHRLIAFDKPTEEVLTVGPKTIQYRPGIQGHTKLGSDGTWIAARRGRDVLMLWTQDEMGNGTYPDGGCALTMYSNTDLGYSEIETQSAFHLLPLGETVSNRVFYRLLELEEDADPVAIPDLLHTQEKPGE
jgi:hypothetical protein